MVVAVRPAGGAWSSVRDMERYVMTELTKGVSPDGKRVVSEANLLERRKQRVRTSDTAGYGLGLVVGTEQGLPTVSHDGGTFGFGTQMFILPEQQVAILSFTNTSRGGPFNEVVRRKVLETLFDGARQRATSLVDFFAARKRDIVARTVGQLERRPAERWLQRLVGSYTNADLGRVQIEAGVRGFTLDAGEWKTAIARKREADGTLKVVLTDAPVAGLELIVGGDAARPTLMLQDAQTRYLFERSR
jgi:hypothetical protein